ncbi:MAG TPA: glycosyltransferase family 4 protein [Bryobacteraceae bacterium]|nr:glycosyltransferase family 4 protein [Bryobacteraceae bacterium]
MRLLHLDSGREMRGGQWQVLYLLEGLAACGHSCVLLARSGSPLFEEAVARGLDVRPLAALTVARLSRCYDLTHAHDARSHTLAAAFARSPLVVSRRVAFPVQSGLLSRWKYSRPMHFIAVSQYVRDMLRSANVKGGLVSVVYDGVPYPDDIVPLAERLRHVVAQDTADRAKGADLVRQAAQISRINIVFSKQLPDDLRRAAVFACITRSEGLGSAVLLAMAAGTPVVASRTGGLPEIIEHQVSGLLTENEPGEIAGAIRRLLDDPALAASLAAHARAQVRDRFSLSNMVAGTLSVYERILR